MKWSYSHMHIYKMYLFIFFQIIANFAFMVIVYA